ncbi:MAG: tRNA pseudouridine(55) synthase TruB [Ruminococcaceae bacterium]|nr:tRNA pseudouridine(55) synthase TruB [Oscillospiraceae bacterium]
MKNGVIIINKEEGISSQGVVSRVKRILGVKKAGHTGTLDPMATGVLPVLIERGVKASEFMLTSDKHYIATLLLGVTTDTEDVTGEVLTECDDIPAEHEVREAVEGFVGEYWQTPPMYSALKVGGKKLCDLARDGIEIDREPRRLTIYSIEVEKISDREYTLNVKCSKGTYIRTLCKDIGEKLGCGGTMKALCRASASGFTLSDALTLSELEAMSESEREARVLPVERIFADLREVTLPDFFSHLAHSGLEIYLKKISLDLPLGTRVRLSDKDGFFAVGEVREFDDGLAIKPIRQF